MNTRQVYFFLNAVRKLFDFTSCDNDSPIDGLPFNPDISVMAYFRFDFRGSRFPFNTCQIVKQFYSSKERFSVCNLTERNINDKIIRAIK